jgi:hypothetical protein
MSSKRFQGHQQVVTWIVQDSHPLSSGSSGSCFCHHTGRHVLWAVVTLVITQDSPSHQLGSLSLMSPCHPFRHLASIAGTMNTIEVINVVTWVINDVMQGSHKVVVSRKRGHHSVFTIGLHSCQNVVTIGHQGRTKVVIGSHVKKLCKFTCHQFGLPKTSMWQSCLSCRCFRFSCILPYKLVYRSFTL